MGLMDAYGRVAADLRVSVTDRCDLRCTYCMPATGVTWLPRPELLTFEELTRVISIAVNLGITSVRLTGGEPLLRQGLPELVAMIAALSPRPRIALTTNGTQLTHLASPLAQAGIDRVNVSLDTVNEATFQSLTRRNRLADVISGLAAANAAGLTPIKINAVAMRGINDTEVPDLLAWCLDRGYELRFIEQMPLDAHRSWRRDHMITQTEILERLSTRFTLTPDSTAAGHNESITKAGPFLRDDRMRRSAPARTWLVDGGPARVGVIASVSQPFCGACDRIRLTADGQVRSCLFARTEHDVRALLRADADDTAVADVLRRTMAGKKPGHGIDDPSFLQPDRPMSAIGG
ncbi:MAG: GTP 3',8-cyclase MoaA [Actinomycetota bacterium]